MMETSKTSHQEEEGVHVVLKLNLLHFILRFITGIIAS